MNNPEVTMHETGINRRFEVQDKAIEAAGIAIQLFDDVRAMTWRLLHPSR